MAFFGPVIKGAMGLARVEQADAAILELEKAIQEVPPVEPGLLSNLSGRRRAEAHLRLLLIEAEWRRRRNENISVLERTIGEVAMQVRQLQLKDTPASKWDIQELHGLISQLATDLKREVSTCELKVEASLAEVKRTLVAQDAAASSLKSEVMRTLAAQEATASSLKGEVNRSLVAHEAATHSMKKEVAATLSRQESRLLAAEWGVEDVSKRLSKAVWGLAALALILFLEVFAVSWPWIASFAAGLY